ncbi:hypothetical protein BDZ45DRAFT_750473 [Acephala macrosclerotiorum]|nr:hypothetical protein BDZ45DRAFT_750473 [Acephala macrosclerotiorum]
MAESKKAVVLHKDIWFIVFDELARQNREELIEERSKRIAEAIKKGSSSREPRKVPGHQRARDTLAPSFVHWIRSLRCLSQDFYLVTAHLAYEFVNLSCEKRANALLSVSDSEGIGRIKANVMQHCRILSLPLERCSIQRLKILDLLAGCKQLECLHWPIEDLDEGDAAYWSSMCAGTFLETHLHCQLWSRAKYVVMQDLSIARNNAPPESWAWVPEDYGCSRSLYFDGNCQIPFQTFVFHGKKLPPIQELVLHGYDWGPPSGNITHPWDFSQLRSLVMRFPENLLHLLQMITTDNLPELQKLDIFMFLEMIPEGDQTSVRKLLLDLMESAPALQVVAINSNVDYQSILPISTIIKLGPKLRKLALHDQHLKNRWTDPRDPISVEDLIRLRENCPNIEEMLVNLPLFPNISPRRRYENTDTFEAERFINVVARFEKLRKVHLFEEDDLGTFSGDREVVESTDSDYDDARAMMLDLYSKKRGVPFEEITITLDRSRKPINWRPPPGAEEGDYEYNFTPRRTFRSRIDESGSYQQWGSDRVGEIPSDDASANLNGGAITGPDDTTDVQDDAVATMGD